MATCRGFSPRTMHRAKLGDGDPIPRPGKNPWKHFGSKRKAANGGHPLLPLEGYGQEGSID